MKVLLYDADMKFPNLALMKLSAWHKAKGDEVKLNWLFEKPDLVYASCIFPKNWYRVEALPFGFDLAGGTGSPLDHQLLPSIEHIMPDYSLYNCDFSMGFTSRGCIRKCPWCIVPLKEGGIRAHAYIYEFWDRRHKKIVLLDNNLLAAPNWKDTLQDLAKERIKVDFNQGLDIRLVDAEKAYWLKQVNFGRYLRFSFDEPQMESKVREGIRILEKVGIKPSRLSFYLLVGFNTSFEQDIERINLLKSYGCDYFAIKYQPVNGVMPRVKWDGPGNLNEFCRWVNVKKLGKNLSYKQWLKLRL